MKTHKLTLLIALSFIVSCSNNDDPAAPPATPKAATMLISKEFDSDDANPVLYTNAFSYDEQNKVTFQLTDDDSWEYTRNADGKIIKATIDNGFNMSAINYTYMTNGKLQKYERINEALAVVEKREYTYFSNRIEEHRFNSTGSLIGINVFYYSTDGTNISLIKLYYGDGTFVLSEEYSFDNKTGIDQVAPYSDLPKFFYNANNTTSIDYIDATGVSLGTRNYSLTYDASGNPLTITDNTALSHTKMNFEYIAK